MKQKRTVKDLPTCVAGECFACEEGQCTVLVDNNFGTRKCPFFKTKEQVANEEEAYEKRLADIRKGNQEE